MVTEGIFKLEGDHHLTRGCICELCTQKRLNKIGKRIIEAGGVEKIPQYENGRYHNTPIYCPICGNAQRRGTLLFDKVEWQWECIFSDFGYQYRVNDAGKADQNGKRPLNLDEREALKAEQETLIKSSGKPVSIIGKLFSKND